MATDVFTKGLVMQVELCLLSGGGRRKLIPSGPMTLAEYFANGKGEGGGRGQASRSS